MVPMVRMMVKPNMNSATVLNSGVILSNRSRRRPGRGGFSDGALAKVGQAIKRRLVALFYLIEQRAHPRRNWMVLAKVLGQRIHETISVDDSEMEMRSGRKSARSDLPDHLSGIDVRARRDLRTDLRQMPIDSRDITRMSNPHAAAQLAAPSCGRYAAVGDSFDRRAIVGDQGDT